MRARLSDLLGSPRLAATRWSIVVRDVASGAALLEAGGHRRLRTASVAKLFLLIEVAARIASGTLDARQPLDRRSVAPVADSGLWQHLGTDTLPLADVAALVGCASDNLATNVLLDVVGLDAVQTRAASLAPDGSTLHDLVRDHRGPGDPPTLSHGTAADWAAILVSLARREVESVAVSDLVLSWLAPSLDLSMVGSAFGLDPLAHAGLADRGVILWNKTGTDAGVRADVGILHHHDASAAYAVICNWDAGQAADPRDAVLQAMRAIGEALADSC